MTPATSASRHSIRFAQSTNSHSCSSTVCLISARIIHDAWASTRRKLVSLGYCSRFVVSANHPRREIDKFAKPASASRESLQRPNQTPVVVNNSGSPRIIHDAWASARRKLVSLGYCSRFVVSASHPGREIDEFAKLASASGESLQRPNQTPVVVNNSGSHAILWTFVVEYDRKCNGKFAHPTEPIS
jgi:hypothetical protein